MPDFRKLIQERLASRNLQPAQEESLIEELTQHLDDLYSDLVAEGMSPEEAFRRAAAELHDLPSTSTQALRQSPAVPDTAVPGHSERGSWLEQVFADVRYAIRGMANHPIFVLFAVLTLALGVGANAAVFTVLNTLILNPLPVQSPSELMSIETRQSAKISESRSAQPLSLPNLEDVAAQNTVFRSLAGYTSPQTMTWDQGDLPQRLFAEFVTGDYFPTLGLRPARGRFFAREEDGRPAKRAIAILNYATWQNKFGADESILNKEIRINGVSVTVIGIAPPSFIGVNAVFGPDLWLPAGIVEQMLPVEMRAALSDRSKAVFKGIARLSSGTTRTNAEANLAAINANLQREFPIVNEAKEVSIRPILTALLGDAPVALAGTLLLAVAGIVLLIACSNVANLLMARAAARQGEIAIRIALGASRGRLLRQLLTENVLLALLGGLVGAGAGYVGAQLLWSFREAQWSANLVSPRFDTSVLLYTFLLSLLTGFVFGTLPAFRAYQAGLSAALKDSTRTIGKARRSVLLSNVLLGGQVAFSALVLVASSLFLRSIQKISHVDPGFEPRSLGIIMVNPSQTGYTETQVRTLYREVKRRVALMSGIEAASWASTLPLWNEPVRGFQIEGREQRSRSDTVASVLHTVDTEYFQATGIHLVEGRDFLTADRDDSAPVAIVNQKLAADYWPGRNAVGKRLMVPGEKQWREIVGVVSNANYKSLGEAPQSSVYIPLEQHFQTSMVLYFRTRGAPGEMLGSVQREIRNLGPRVLSDDARTGTRIVEQAMMVSKIAVTLLSVFGALALALASVGLYGNLAYAVQTRRREIGVRMALGADRSSVIGLVLKQGMLPVVTGLVIGLGLSLMAGKLLMTLLYGVSPNDAVSLVISTLILLIVGAAACSLPAWSASRVDPLTTLREV
ncbi:MAG TPA: ABC transporter permease [Bryobacteraceae bacterium]|nr:ABC transporter permease [Bryobacteraceae bacterium]